ncbi:hypothetical protein HMN09_00446100 [Mycena chlorophos]|uniref:Uncharacterized protein n=1 Tax=Mycena chlorophos TaxID=658473 RepID=A0A8H6WFT6_MYCCL|nr:hypothetical protein HMN09_00446100 [Mycena chlorophos]
MQPALPLELERYIFELTSNSFWTCIPRLALVACRVRNWVEPILYRTLILTKRTPRNVPICSPETLQELLRTKTRKFIAANVRNVFLYCVPMEQVPEILEHFENLQNIYLLPDTSGVSVGLPTGNNLQHLYCALVYIRNKLTDTIFARLTHLELFSGISDENTASAIVALPSLSHLALDRVRNTGRLEAVFKILLASTRLRAILLLASVSASTMSQHGLEEDPRVVVVPDFDYLEDWARGALFGDDFWARADVLIAKRLSGEVPRTNFRLDSLY